MNVITMFCVIQIDLFRFFALPLSIFFLVCECVWLVSAEKYNYFYYSGFIELKWYKVDEQTDSFI